MVERSQKSSKVQKAQLESIWSADKPAAAFTYLLVPERPIMEPLSPVWGWTKIWFVPLRPSLMFSHIQSLFIKGRLELLAIVGEKRGTFPSDLERTPSDTLVEKTSPCLFHSPEVEAGNCWGICLKNRFLCPGAEVCGVKATPGRFFAISDPSRILSRGCLQS